MLKDNASLNTQFAQHFSEVYGERWPLLLKALQEDELQVARRNGFAEREPVERPAGLLSGTVVRAEASDSARDAAGLLQYYVMDPASILAARSLGVRAGDRVLDMCAAPGGKTLILSEALAESGELIANEVSQARRERLTKVIQQYIPRTVRDRVWVTGKDGGLYAKSHPEQFDRVLVDAPCSGERHLLRSPKDMAQWSVKRGQQLSQRQYALMTAALYALKAGGRVLYSTCSISPTENDGVIERLLEKAQKKGPQFQVLPVVCEIQGEKTQYGYQYLPDHFGFGPIYFSLLEKN